MYIVFFTSAFVCFRVKVPSGPAHREALVFGKRLNAHTARDLGIVDTLATEETMMDVAMDTVNAALGRMNLSQGFLNDMKTDVYDRSVPDEKMTSKL